MASLTAPGQEYGGQEDWVGGGLIRKEKRRGQNVMKWVCSRDIEEEVKVMGGVFGPVSVYVCTSKYVDVHASRALCLALY